MLAIQYEGFEGGSFPPLIFSLSKSLQLPLGLPIREGRNVVVGGGTLEQPLWSDISHGADPVFGGQHELVVEDPLRGAVKAGRGVDLDLLVVLHGQVEALLIVGHLHKETAHQRLPDVGVVLLGLKGSGLEGQVRPLHDVGKLKPDILRGLHGPLVDVVIVTPVIISGLPVGVEHVQQREVVTINMCEPCLGLISCLLLVIRPNKAIFCCRC
jgi:hypothetical protein